MKDIGLASYQDIKTPEEIEEERNVENVYNNLLQDFDPEMGNFNSYKLWARREARKEVASWHREEEEEEE